MITEPTMLKIEGAKQMAKVATMAGNTYTVVPSSTGAMGVTKWITLTPVNTGTSAPITLKIEGARQMAAANNLAGKNVFIDPSPTLVAGKTSKFLVMTPVKNATAVSATQMTDPATLVQVEGKRQAMQVSKYIGKKVTIVPAPNMVNANNGMIYFNPAGSQTSVGLKIQDANAMDLGGMSGKSYTITKAPMATGNTAGNWLLFKPSGEAASVTVAGTDQVPPAPEMTMPKMQTVAMQAPLDPATATAATGTAVSGTIWNGGGMSLGLGLGLGAAGPVLLGAALVGSGYGSWLAYKKYKEKQAEAEAAEAALEGELAADEGAVAEEAEVVEAVAAEEPVAAEAEVVEDAPEEPEAAEAAAPA
ncbi:magnetosome protein MamD [Magnetococcus sp. PR-3]|uniref:magnetosome protein MamD n=1 Tax=Magnetococcus sp. PR-3 TaxID=3120355 RepID=UPI002FCE1506